jgi:hypothetical protein
MMSATTRYPDIHAIMGGLHVEAIAWKRYY